VCRLVNLSNGAAIPVKSPRPGGNSISSRSQSPSAVNSQATHAQKRTPGRNIPSYSAIVRDLGANTARLLQQVIFWNDPDQNAKDPEGWIYKWLPELVLETGLTKREIGLAFNRLIAKGLVTKERHRGGGRRGCIRFRLNEDEYWDYYETYCDAYEHALKQLIEEEEKRGRRPRIVKDPSPADETPPTSAALSDKMFSEGPLGNKMSLEHLGKTLILKGNSPP
jgi:hypothetical protein